jgi:TRAP-type C4-dicarboxylate transport system substrate-binding protein
MVTSLACLALVAGCQSSDQVTKAGGQAAPITLRIGTDDGPGRPAADQIEQFAREVAARSGGRLRIEPVWQAAGDAGQDDWDQKVARMVVSGDLDLGNIPTRAWDTEGVTTLRALNAPMLVTDDALVKQVISGDLAPQLMAGLDSVGITGLALLPEGMRRVFWFRTPLTTVASFKGARLRVPASATTYATFTALGALPDDVSNSGDAIDQGLVAGAETSFLLASSVNGASTAAGNLPLWPKVNGLVANRRVLDGLPADLRTILTEAAVATRGWAFDAVPADAQAARDFCAEGGTVVLVDPATVASFRRATAPVTAELVKDATTRSLIASITDLAREQAPSATPVQACAPAKQP